MTLEELRTRLRGPGYLRDVEAPYLYDGDFLDWCLNEAQREAALRANLVREDSVEIPLTAGTAVYPFPDGIVVMQVLPDRVYLLSNPDVALREYSLRSRSQTGLLRNLGTGTPCYYALDSVDGAARAVRFDPVPVKDDSALLDVVRLPLLLRNDADVPEIHPQWHPDLLDWAASLALGDPILDTFDAQRAAMFAARFEGRMGPRVTALEMNRRQTDQPLTIIVE